MGVDITHYVVVGYRFSYKDFKSFKLYDDETEDEFYDAYSSGFHDDSIKNPDGIAVIMDGMGGSYVVIGRIIARTFEYEGLPMVEIDTNGNDKLFEEISNQINELVKHRGPNVLPEDVQVLVFGHYS